MIGVNSSIGYFEPILREAKLDVWDEARTHLDGLPGGGGLNIAFEAVDRHVAHGRGEAIAFRFVAADFSIRTVTFAELMRQTNRFANVLGTLGVGAGDMVFAFADRRPEVYVAALGCLKVRGVFSALFASLGEQALQSRLAKGLGKALITVAPLYARRVAPIRAALPLLRHVLIAGDDASSAGTLDLDRLMQEADDTFSIPPTDPEDPAFVHFTSGTRGSPKGVVHVHAAAIAHHSTAASVLGLRSDDVLWCTADPGWVLGTSYGLIAPLLHGVETLIDEDAFDATRAYRIIQDHKVSVLYTTPTAIRVMMTAGSRLARTFDLSSLRLIVSAGEALNPEAVRWGRQTFALDIHDTWWQTETGAIVIGTPAAEDVVLGTIGTAVPGIEAAVAHRRADGSVEIVRTSSEVGELVLSAGWPSMFRTYLGEPERYERSFSDGWYLTGDCVCRTADGRFSFVARADEVIKSAGQLIGPSEVEACLLEYPGVAEVGAVGTPDPIIGEAVKVFVVLHDGVAADETLRVAMIEFARHHLGADMAPREIAFCRDLPKTRSGKIVRSLLKARELGLPEGAFDFDDLDDSLPA
ncbi:MAG: AMP-binding protein [Rhodospirillales bacterium]|nr:AMP-binding protein [Rhodospirillales bacterium]